MVRMSQAGGFDWFRQPGSWTGLGSNLLRSYIADRRRRPKLTHGGPCQPPLFEFRQGSRSSPALFSGLGMACLLYVWRFTVVQILGTNGDNIHYVPDPHRTLGVVGFRNFRYSFDDGVQYVAPVRRISDRRSGLIHAPFCRAYALWNLIEKEERAPVTGCLCIPTGSSSSTGHPRSPKQTRQTVPP